MSRDRNNTFDVIVIGGGPAGMMAAGTAASRGKRVALIEKNKVLGKKLSITGGGRCNITNAEEDVHELLGHFGDAKDFLFSPFSQFGVKDTFQFFAERGLPLVVEARKRAFPETQSAPDVTETMKKYVTEHNVTLKLGTRTDGFITEEGKVIGVKTNQGDFYADTFVLATGGKSHSETGSTGEGINWLQELGHTTHEPNPDIVPLMVAEEWVKELSGTTLSFMKITFGEGKEKVSRVGKLLFTHFGLSGPLILNSAHEVKELLKDGPVDTTIDLFPDTEIGTVRRRVLGAFDVNKNKMVKNVLSEIAPDGMTKAILSLLPEELREQKVHSVSKDERNYIADLMKGMPCTVTDTMGYDWAVVSDGGVDLREVDTRTMKSTIHDNLYIIGDALHISRPSGGYSLQLCWTTGYVAGKNLE
ncbi:aminoacetone oxidase family FAD-binding enzyme [Candidatus Kaiserbacteria bacterium]|nr:aminoacetone oxidase family FAD-binding enzyme [Candidatus Kaiserbacteria bacterium]